MSKGRLFVHPAPELPPPSAEPVRRYLITLPEDVAQYAEDLGVDLNSLVLNTVLRIGYGRSDGY